MKVCTQPASANSIQLPAELVESLSDSLAAMLVAEWHRRHPSWLRPQGGQTIEEHSRIDSSSCSGKIRRIGLVTHSFPSTIGEENAGQTQQEHADIQLHS